MKIDLRGLRKSESDPKECSIPEDYVEVIPRYIGLFKGSWLKYTNKETGKSYPGGFLIDFDAVSHKAVLRNIQQQISELSVKDNLFYCKNDLDIYKAVQDLAREWEKLDIERAKLNAEKNKLLDMKKKFYAKSNIDRNIF